MGLPRGDDVVAFRDRAILRFYLYTGARIGTGCRLKVSDFKDDHENATIRMSEKGNRRRTIGLHFIADLLPPSPPFCHLFKSRKPVPEPVFLALPSCDPRSSSRFALWLRLVLAQPQTSL